MTMDLMEMSAAVVVSALSGALVGLERQARNHPAGIRTHALVAIGAATFTIAGAGGFDAETTDPTRIAAQVASGIGFIGAGAILKEGATVRGLTTATSVWVAGAMGVAAGSGYFELLSVATAVTLTLLVVVGMFKGHIDRAFRPPVAIAIEYRRGHGTLAPVLRIVDRLHARPASVAVDDSDDHRTLRLTLLHLAHEHIGDLLEAVRSLDEVVHVSATCPSDDG